MTDDHSPADIAFVGLGAMGMPMAQRLGASGLRVAVFDRDTEKAAKLSGSGNFVVAADAREAASLASLSICIVETGAQTRDVLLGPAGIVQGACPGHRVACMSTLDPLLVREVGAALAARGISVIDAPVSGGPPRAVTGTLAIYCGGADEDIDAFQTAFSAIGERVLRMGALGQGMAMKLINNMLHHINTVAVAESLVLARKAGLDVAQFCEAVRSGSGHSAAFDMRVQRMIDHDFRPGGTSDISFKDQELVTSFAKNLGVPLLLPNVTQQVYQMARVAGFSKQDGSAIVTIYERLAALTPRQGDSKAEDAGQAAQ